MPDPITLLSALASVAEIASFIKENLARDRKITPEELKAAQLAAKRTTFSEADKQAILALHPKLADAYEKKLEQLLDDLASYISRPTTSASGIRNQASSINAEICMILSAVQDQSGGVLPSPYFEKLWRDHGCK